MEISEAVAFVRENHRGVLATLRSDGAPQLSPVSAGADEHGRVLISTRETAMKTKNLRRHRRAWLCVFNDRFFGEWVQVEGDVEIVTLPEAMEPLVAYYRMLAGEHPNWDEYREAMERERRVLLVMTVDRAGPTRRG